MLVKLKELLTIKNGADYKHLQNGNIPVIGTGGIMLYVNKFLYDKEAILLPRKGSLNNVMYINTPFWTVDTMFYAIPNHNKVNAKYLFYHLSLLDFTRYDVGSTIPSMTSSLYYSLSIDLPSLDTQNKIASILSQLDSQIERNNAMVKKLQVLSQAIFNKWFRQFEFPNFDGLFEFNDVINSNLPVGWIACKLTDCIKWESSSQPPKSTFSNVPKDGYIRFIQNRDYDSQNHLTYIPYKNTTKTCTKYDIMIDKYGDAGKIRCGLEGAFNVALAKITPTINSSQEYIRCFLSLDSNYEYLHNACMASTRASLNEQTLNGIIVPIPTQKVLNEFETIMKKIMNCRFSIVESTAKLQNIKEKLLPLLINGELN